MVARITEIPTRAQIVDASTHRPIDGARSFFTKNRILPVAVRLQGLSEAITAIEFDARDGLRDAKSKVKNENSLLARAIRSMDSIRGTDQHIIPDIVLSPGDAEVAAANLLLEALQHRDPKVGQNTIRVRRHTYDRHIPRDSDINVERQMRQIDGALQQAGMYGNYNSFEASGEHLGELVGFLRQLQQDPAMWWDEERQADVANEIELISKPNARINTTVETIPTQGSYYAMRGEQVLRFSSQEAIAYADTVIDAREQLDILRRRGEITNLGGLINEILSIKDHDEQVPLLVEVLYRSLFNGTISYQDAISAVSSVENNITRGESSDSVATYRQSILNRTLQLYSAQARVALEGLI